MGFQMDVIVVLTLHEIIARVASPTDDRRDREPNVHVACQLFRVFLQVRLEGELVGRRSIGSTRPSWPSIDFDGTSCHISPTCTYARTAGDNAKTVCSAERFSSDRSIHMTSPGGISDLVDVGPKPEQGRVFQRRPGLSLCVQGLTLVEPRRPD